MASFADGQRVVDERHAAKLYSGTVIQTRGNMYNDTAVLVDWDGGIGENWENPDSIKPE